ncbi:tripartite tricarboxylate transporter permease [Roseibium sp. MMSF_3544]|uniref:tripartite tricarboxylate transporter permease n=1 Tax=unclassified Roseibium TaxID=2629323 RepID=UPI00273DE3D5|nr:tripartite tricarboxylate transporter permease [Roseibium sp. MMSF_3544]
MPEVTVVTEGFGLLWDWRIPAVILMGLAFGLLVGSVPGLTAALGLAIALPFTLTMDQLPALMLLTAIYTGSLTGGGITAILMNAPGTPGAVVTAIDGYAMTKSGRYNQALGLQICASVIGGFVGYIALFFLVQPLSDFALRFGPAEMLALTILVIVTIGSLDDAHFLRVVYSGVLGMLIATIGTSVTTGIPRGSMGIRALEDGVPAVLSVIGLFAIPELISLGGRSRIVASDDRQKTSVRDVLNGARQGLAFRGTLAQGSFIGVLIGVLPAAGATMASLLSYASARRRAKSNEKFGEGAPRGVVAAESANNATEAGSMAILLAIGIPGGAATAVILGGFILHGLVPGPRLFVDNGPAIYGLIFGNMVQMVIVGVMAVGFASIVAHVVRAPSSVLIPCLLISIGCGAFSLRGQLADVAIIYIFGLIGYFYRSYKFAATSLMIGLFLGARLDAEIVRFAVLYGDNLMGAIMRPIAASLLAIAFLITCASLWGSRSR